MTDHERTEAQRQRRAQRRQHRRPGRSGEAGGAVPTIVAEDVPAVGPVTPGTVGDRLDERQRGALRRIAANTSV